MARRIFLTLVLAAALAPVAEAQRTQAQPGFLILRVVLKSGGGTGATGGFSGSSGSSGGYGSSGQQKPGGGSSGGYGNSGQQRPGGSSGGGFGTPPGFGTPGTPAAAGEPKDDPTKSVVVVVPYSNHARAALYPKLPGQGRDFNPFMETVKTEYGTTPVYNDPDSLQAYWLRTGFSYEGQLKKKHRDWERDDKSVQGIYDLTAEALAYGLNDLAFAYAEETLKLAGSDAKLPPTVAAFVKAYTPLLAKMGQGLPTNPEAARLQSRLRANAYDQSAHYALLYYSDTPRALVARRLQVFEETFKAFYLFYALEGVELPLPSQKLLGLLAPTTQRFYEFHSALDGGPVSADGFFASQYNLVVLAPERLDDAGRTFNNYARTRFRVGVNPDELVAGNAPKPQEGKSPAEYIELMTLALVQRQIDEDAATGAVTREGIKQLFAAAGLLSPHVSPPRWLEDGIGSFLQVPKGPVYTQEKDGPLKMTVGLARGFGWPNYELSRRFREMVEHQEVNPDRSAILLNTIADKYFDAATAGKDLDPPPAGSVPKGIGAGTSPSASAGSGMGGYGGRMGGMGKFGGTGGLGGFGSPDGGAGMGGMGGMGGGPSLPAVPGQPDPAQEERERKEQLATKAQVYAWGLTFFLAKKKPQQFRQFLADLNRKPRDMRLDPVTVRTAFGTAFNLSEKGDPSRLEPAAVKKFADEWINFLRTLPAPNEVVVNQVSDPNTGIDAGGSGGFGGAFGGGGGSNDGGGR